MIFSPVEFVKILFFEAENHNMNKTDLIIDLVTMRQHGEFHTENVLNNIGIRHGRSIHMPMISCAIYLDCEYNAKDLPSYIHPYRYDSEKFWG